MNQPHLLEPQGTNTPHPNLVAKLIARMSLTQLTLVALVAVFAWQWLDAHQQFNNLQQEVTRRLAEVAGSNQANQVLVTQQQEMMRDISAKIALLEARFAETQDQRAALEALYGELSASRDENALADVEQLLLIAAQQLQLSANVKAALIAVQNADARLQRMNRPSFNSLRRIIDQDMEKLRVLPDLDEAGVNAQIGNLLLTVDSVPLSYQQRVTSQPVATPPKEETTWQKLVREIWQEAKQLVRIQDTGKAEIPLLPPNQEFFLRENLKLHLMAARLALLAHDEASFRQEFVSMQDWVLRYFDANSAEGARMLDALQKLAKLSINVDLPDISASLQAVRTYRLTHAR